MYKKHTFAKIFPLLLFVAALFSCERNSKTSGENSNGLFLEKESTDNNGDKGDELFSDNSEELSPKYDRPHRDMTLTEETHDLLYRYDGYHSMRFGEYFYLDVRNKDVPTEDGYTEYEGTGFIPEGPPGYEEKPFPKRQIITPQEGVVEENNV